MDCVACGSAAVLRGSVGSDFATPRFEPDGLAFLTFRRSIGLDDHRFHACTSCGHLWNECDAADLRRFVDGSGSDELLAQLRMRAAPRAPLKPNAPRNRAQLACPACHDPVFVGGAIQSKHAVRFHPEGMRLLTWTRSMEINAMDGLDLARACTSCGHVWGALDASLLRNLVRSAGTDELRDRLLALGMP